MFSFFLRPAHTHTQLAVWLYLLNLLLLGAWLMCGGIIICSPYLRDCITVNVMHVNAKLHSRGLETESTPGSINICNVDYDFYVGYCTVHNTKAKSVFYSLAPESTCRNPGNSKDEVQNFLECVCVCVFYNIIILYVFFSFSCVQWCCFSAQSINVYEEIEKTQAGVRIPVVRSTRDHIYQLDSSPFISTPAAASQKVVEMLPTGISTQATNHICGTASKTDDTYSLATNPVPPADIQVVNQNSETDDTYSLTTHPVLPTVMPASNHQHDPYITLMYTTDTNLPSLAVVDEWCVTSCNIMFPVKALPYSSLAYYRSWSWVKKKIYQGGPFQKLWIWYLIIW